jgi:hypothetical protein
LTFVLDGVTEIVGFVTVKVAFGPTTSFLV